MGLSATSAFETLTATGLYFLSFAADIDQRFVFLTNNFQIPSPTVAAIHHQRWQIELFFKSHIGRWLS